MLLFCFQQHVAHSPVMFKYFQQLPASGETCLLLSFGLISILF